VSREEAFSNICEIYKSVVVCDNMFWRLIDYNSQNTARRNKEQPLLQDFSEGQGPHFGEVCRGYQSRRICGKDQANSSLPDIFFSTILRASNCI
jgi:hypothetical protein